MKVVKVTERNGADLIDYCRRYGGEHDDSYTGPDDLNEETLKSEDNPSYLLLDGCGTVAGAASLMLEGYREKRKGRLRIFHCLSAETEYYSMLLGWILNHTEGIDDIYIFIPAEKTDAAAILEELGFAVWRRSYVLERGVEGCEEPSFPAGFALTEFVPGHDEGTWCDIMNTCFAHLAGHTEMTPEIVGRYAESEGHIPGGMKILWREGKPAGAVRTTKEGAGCGSIEQVAVIPDCQRQGLGRQLLRAGIAKAREAGCESVTLSVNGENEKAVTLYLDEGFNIKECMVCYDKHVE